MPGTREREDRELARRRRVVEERVQAAPPQRVGHLARGVGREEHERAGARRGWCRAPGW